MFLTYFIYVYNMWDCCYEIVHGISVVLKGENSFGDVHVHFETMVYHYHQILPKI